VVSEAWLNQQDRWQSFLVDIEAQIAAFSTKGLSTTESQQLKSAGMGIVDAGALVKSVGLTAGFKMLPKGAVHEIVGSMSLGSPLRKLFLSMGPGAVATARTIFYQEIAAGSHPRVIAKRFMDELELTRHRAILIARTESIRAYRAAQAQSYAANSDVVIARRRMCARDGRTCFLCWAEDGTVYPHGEPSPDHPGCRCGYVPVVIGLDDPGITGEEAFVRLSDGEQEDILGPGRYKLYADGKRDLRDFVGVKDDPTWGPTLRAKPIATVNQEVLHGIKAAPQMIHTDEMSIAAARPSVGQVLKSGTLKT
jgi:SPP1 gp7 family putative phage head morphogenesis protein